MKRKRSIGAVLLLESPDEDRRAVLQIRDSKDSFPGCSQLTVHGRVEEDEDLRTALKREAREELAELFARAILPVPKELKEIVDSPPDPLRVEGRASTEKEQVASLSLTVRNSNIATLIQPLVEAGVVRFVSQDNLQAVVSIDPKNPNHKQCGVGKGLIGMFADERRVLEQVLSAKG